MDRPLQPALIQQNRWKYIWKTALVVAVLAGGLLWLVSWISPSVQRNQLRIAEVTAGPIEASISANGMLVPEVELVLTSSIDSRILRILKKAGDTIRANEPVVLLDTEAARQAYRKLKDQLEMKKNAGKQLVYVQANEQASLLSQLKVKELELEAAKTVLSRNKSLFQDKVISREELEKCETAYNTLKAQVKELAAKSQNSKPTAKLQQEAVTIETRIMQHDLALLEQELARAAAHAERSGVLTWVTLSEGATIRKGDVIAKIADLSSYRVDATLSDIHASRLVVGMPVIILLDEKELAGTISTILPTIENGVMKIQVSLKDRSNSILRPNRRVDVHIVTGRKEQTLKVRKGVNAGSDGATEVFVLRGNKAVRTRIQTGLANYEEVEIVQGLQPGDEIIISDMSQYQHLKEVEIK